VRIGAATRGAVVTIPPGHVPLTVAARIIGRAADALRREVRDGHLAALRTAPTAWMWIKPGDARALQAAGPVRCLPTPSGTIAETDPTVRGRGRPRAAASGMIRT
jgi:hypothetical protein